VRLSYVMSFQFNKLRECAGCRCAEPANKIRRRFLNPLRRPVDLCHSEDWVKPRWALVIVASGRSLPTVMPALEEEVPSAFFISVLSFIIFHHVLSFGSAVQPIVELPPGIS
jgi:hypothetical protein